MSLEKSLERSGEDIRPEQEKEPLTGAPGAEDLALIGKYTRRALNPEEVYVFPVILCDNEIDRDGERFSIPALEELAKLFVGKTGIFDHEAKGKNQTARIYRCRVVREEGRRTAAGETFHALRADAYMLRTPGTEELIREIDGGIKKEVSVGCAVASARCSICGADRRKEGCAHRPGERYEGKLCHVVLDGATDAYEWSFVAVPAQPGAGVVKGFAHPAAALEKAMESGKGLDLSPAEADRLARWTGELRQLAEEGRILREKAVKEAVRLGRLSLPGLSRELLEKALGPLPLGELEQWTEECRRRAGKRLPIPQTAPAPEREKNAGENESFIV